MIRGIFLSVDSGVYLGMIICLNLLVFIFTMRAFDRVLKLKFVYATLALLVASVLAGGQLAAQLQPSLTTGRYALIYAKYSFVLIALVIFGVIAFKDNPKRSTRDKFIILFMIIVIGLGALHETAGVFNNCLIPSCAISLLFLYMYMYAERYNVDSVSKCYKRRCFYSDAEKYGKHSLAIVSMDLNDLKMLNDNYGHKAGDIALLTFAEVCRSVKPKNFILYRTGGDEFMMLGIKATLADTEALVRRIKERLTDTPYASSFGIYMYDPSEDFDAAVIKADQAMYEDKRAYKESRVKRFGDQFEDGNDSFTNNINFLD